MPWSHHKRVSHEQTLTVRSAAGAPKELPEQTITEIVGRAEHGG